VALYAVSMANAPWRKARASDDRRWRLGWCWLRLLQMTLEWAAIIRERKTGWRRGSYVIRAQRAEQPPAWMPRNSFRQGRCRGSAGPGGGQSSGAVLYEVLAVIREVTARAFRQFRSTHELEVELAQLHFICHLEVATECEQAGLSGLWQRRLTAAPRV